MSRQELVARYKQREKTENTEHARRISISLIIIIVTALTTILFVIILILVLYKNRRISLEKINIELAAQKAKLEKALLQDQLAEKDKQLAMKTTADLKRNEIISDAVEKLMIARKGTSVENPETIGRIIINLNKTKEVKVWEEFDIRFQQMQQGFFENLQKACPGLSANERRLCAFLRMNMSTKEIAAMTGQSLLSIHKSRNRLRKKLNITNQGVGLVEFIASI